MTQAIPLLELQPDQPLPPSPWVTIDQAMIDQFAQVTGDHQWIHVDEQRCAKESPLGCTIAHGLLTTALMPGLFYQQVFIDEKRDSVLNYGMDNVRYLEPVRVNDRIRYHSCLKATENKPRGVLFRFTTTVEIDWRDKPAMIGEFLLLRLTT
ncbi:MaoC family dehydratase [Aestuariibacter halophilus]|uniref:MaoC family dehydratase n=1 Tax=Fluctibacter halophilus TaxID=226011 RepID=A0ABS8G3W1_9ALTE|nr:MaoC family dehydratase [Aestuariibacter halophilus]MCC2615220.1 MaoC family dehydratase [Aestuariibacter halophilus]